MTTIGKPILLLSEVSYTDRLPSGFLTKNRDTDFQFRSETTLSDKIFTSLFSMDKAGLIDVFVLDEFGKESRQILDSEGREFVVEESRVSTYGDCVCTDSTSGSSDKNQLVIIIIAVCIPIALCIGLVVGCLCRGRWRNHSGYQAQI